MDLTLQFGYGMMEHSRSLLRSWGGGEVVLSPRDLSDDQLRRMATQVKSIGGKCMVDPQCYVRTADHERLMQHPFWEIYGAHTTGAFMGGPGTEDLLKALSELNEAMDCPRVILPGLLAPRVDEDWFAFQEAIIEESTHHFGDRLRLATVALSPEAAHDEDQVEEVVERSASWNVDGYYVVVESPGSYLVDDPVWLGNVLSLLAGLHLQRRYVVLGYANHQMLTAAAANIDAIASGTWMNVRAFSPDRFMVVPDGDIRRRATWYYCPQALSEYKVPFLDIARQAGLLNDMRPLAGYPDEHCSLLFGGATPSSTGWSEQQAFRHFLSTLRHQAQICSGADFDGTYTRLMTLFDEAEALCIRLQDEGIFSQQRDGSEVLDVNRSALIQLRRSRGGRLRREW